MYRLLVVGRRRLRTHTGNMTKSSGNPIIWASVYVQFSFLLFLLYLILVKSIEYIFLISVFKKLDLATRLQLKGTGYVCAGRGWVDSRVRVVR